MISKQRKAFLGWLLGIMVLFFFIQAPLMADVEATPNLKSESSFQLQSFTLKQADSLPAAEGTLDLAQAPAPINFKPQAPSLEIIPGSSFGNSVFKASLALNLVLNAGDYFTTREALRYPGTMEGNPVLKGIVGNPIAFAAVKLGATALSVYLLNSIYKKNKTLGWIMSMVANSVLAYAVVNNYRAIQIARR
jgi:hypothetical protein